MTTEVLRMMRWMNARGGSGHITDRRGDRTSQLPMHGGRKELGRGLGAKIKKDVGLD